MKSIMLTLVQKSATTFFWTLADGGDEPDLATPEFELGFEINALVRGFLSDPRPDNGKRLSGALGKTIMGTPVSQCLDRHLAYTSDCVVYLSIPDSVAHMPWEMMRLNPEGTSLALGLPTSRLAPDLDRTAVFINQCILVSPRHHGVVRDRTLYSSTRRLSRHAELEVLELEPATLSSLKRNARSGNLLVHFEGVNGDQVALEDGVISVAQVPIDKPTWLVVLGGTEGSLLAAQEFASAAVVQSISRSFTVHPRSQAIFERSFYHALADGDSVSIALFRARHSVAESDAMVSFQGAAYVCTVRGGANLADQYAFPPPQTRSPEALELTGHLKVEKLRSPLRNLSETPAHAIPLSVFIQESIQVLRGGLESDHQREARKAVLRRLAARHTSSADVNEMPTEPSLLRRFFEELVGIPDQPLGRVRGRAEEIQSLSTYVGIDARCTDGLVHAIRANPILHVASSDLRQARSLIRGIAESIYGYCPRFYTHGDSRGFFDGPSSTPGGAYDAGGGFARALSSHWRRDEASSLQPDKPQPLTRLPSLGRVGDAWHIFAGTWLVLEIDSSWSPYDEQTIMRALDNRVFDGFNRDGRPFRLAVPKDFRVLLLSSASVSVKSVVPRIELDANQTAASGLERWNTYLTDNFGPPAGLTEIQYRSKFLDEFSRLFLWLQLRKPSTIGQGERLLGTAYSIGGEPDVAIGQAVRTLHGESTWNRLSQCESLQDLGREIQELVVSETLVTSRHKRAAIELWSHLTDEALELGEELTTPKEFMVSLGKAVKSGKRSARHSVSANQSA